VAALQARVTGMEGFVGALRSAFEGREIEGLIVAGFGVDDRICGVAVNSEHRSLSFVKAWELSNLAIELDAARLIVVVFPNGRARRPSEFEVAAFRDLEGRLRRVGLLLLDCLVDRGDRLWSLRDLSRARHDSVA
jgi:hypothetical protein